MNLVVVGGGPTGAAAAITARRAGLSVTLLEAACGPRFRPGETLHPGVEPILEKLEMRAAILDAGYLRHSGTWVEWGSAARFVPFGSDDAGPWRGFQAPRVDFDQRLLNKVRELGIQIRERTPARGIIRQNSRVVGVRTGAETIRADHVIDASGSTHWLARQLGIPIVRHSINLMARYGYVSGARLDRTPSIRADADGWTWVADVGEDRSVWVRVATPDRMVPATWIPDEMRGGRASFSGRADVTWRMAAQTAGDGWFMCGDAALVLDPSSSHGVLRGLMSGMAAANSAVNACGTDGVTRRIDYEGMLRDWFRYDSRIMSEHYSSVNLFGY